jgi:endoplasmic reticulum Man9GlcNAc2 1,2-alpha-mannosidase
MLGATKTGATVHKVSIPPKPRELTKEGLRDWKSGVELVKTCMRTHDTATFVIFSRFFGLELNWAVVD